MISIEKKTDDRHPLPVADSKPDDCTTPPDDYVMPPHRTFEFTAEEAEKFEAFLAEENEKGPTPALLAAFAQRQRNQAMSRNHK